MRRWVLLVLLPLTLLGACPHRVAGGDTARFTTSPVCPGAVRKSDFEILRAGFAVELEANEVEALQELEHTYLEYAELPVDYPSTDSAAEASRYARSLGRKRQALDRVVAEYQPFVDAPRRALAVMSLYRIGEAHELLAVDIENTRVPTDSTQAAMASFCADLFASTRGLRATAQRHYRRCAELAREAGVDDRWSQACGRKLPRG